MNFFDVLEAVKKGEIKNTYEYNVSIIKTHEDSEKYATFNAINEAMIEGYLDGDIDESNGVFNYTNIKLTAKGEYFNEWGTLTVDQIKNPNFIQKVKNGILGAISGKLFLFLMGLLIFYFFPDLKLKADQILGFLK